MKRKTKFLCALVSAFAVCFGAGIASANFAPVSAASENIEMLAGASIRYASQSGTNGLRFTAQVPEAAYKEGAVYGMLIAPEDYVAENPLDYENVFGENAVYDWAVENSEGEYVYSGTKTRIINIVYNGLGSSINGQSRVINGSILNIKEGNLSRNFVGRAYVKDGNDYTMADYASVEGVSGTAYNTRSALEVAERAYLTEGLNFDEGQQTTLEEYITGCYSSVPLTESEDYVRFINKYATDITTQNISQTGEITEDLPEGFNKGYILNCDYATNYGLFNNINLNEYVRLKFYIKGKYSIPFFGRDDTKENEWVSVEYIRQWNGVWRIFYDGERLTNSDDNLYIGLNGVIQVTELIGVKDVCDDVFTVTYKNGDDVLYTEAVRKGRAAAYKLGGTEDLGDGYIKESTVNWVTENEGTVIADLSAVTANATVYFSGEEIVYRNYEKPNYTNIMSINKYIKADANGNITFKVRYHGGSFAFWVYGQSGGWSAYCVGQSAEEGKWYTVTTDAATKTVYVYDENGSKLQSAVFEDFDVTKMSLCANEDGTTIDVATKLLPQLTVTYLDSDGTLLSEEKIDKGSSGAEFVPAERAGEDGYNYIYENVKWLDENGEEVNLSAVTANTTVYFGGDKIVYTNYEKPNYTNIMSINKYIKADASGNITFKVRYHGGSFAFWVYGQSGGYSAYFVGQYAEEGKWYTVTTDAATKTVYVYDENGSKLQSAVFEEFDVTQMSLCANENGTTIDVAAVIVKKKIDLTTVIVLDSYKSEIKPSDESGRMYQYAVEELTELYKKIGGKTLTVKYVSSAAEIPEDENCFVLGSGFASAAGFDCLNLSTDTGYSIRKSGGNVYLYGKTGFGTLNAVYGFFSAVYNLEFYTDEVYTFEEKEFKYAELEDTDFNPSIDYNWASGTLEYIKSGEEDPNYAYQRRLNFVNPWQMMGGDFHNYFTILPQETYKAKYPKWYTEGSTPDGETFETLNLAYGLQETDSLMAKTVAEYIYNNVTEAAALNYKKPVWIFGQPDLRGWSVSAESEAIKEKYGSNSAESILFVKKVAQILDENYTIGRKLQLVVLAYNLSLQAPTKNLGDLEFYNGDEISMGVMFAPIESNLYRSATDDNKGWSEHCDASDEIAPFYEKSNAYYFGQLTEWKKLLNGGDMLCYYYSAHYDNYFVPMDSISNMQSKYAAFSDAGVKHMYNLGQRGDDVTTDWTALKIYLQSKYAENAYRTDGEQLILNFCNAYYGAAGATMKKLLDEECAQYKKASEYWLSVKGGDPTGCHLIRKYLFDKNAWGGDDNGATLLSLYQNIETALSLVEENSAEWNRIKVEGLTFRYLLAGIYGNTTKGTMAEIAADAKALGVDIFAEGSTFTATEVKQEDGSYSRYGNSNKIEDLA